MHDVRNAIAPLAAGYRGSSILNLAASIERACGGQNPFDDAHALDVEHLSGRRHIVLLLLDGLGDALLSRFGSADGVLRRHQIGTLTSVFPTTTSAAISTLMTAHPPAQHGIMAWHMHLPRGIYTTLLAQYREDQQAPRPSDRALYHAEPVFGRLGRATYQIQPRYLLDSPFSLRHRGRAAALPASNFNELLGQITHVTSHARDTFSYAYWPELDAIGHKSGVASQAWRQALAQVERGIDRLLTRLAGRSVSLLITADHGMVDAEGGRCESIEAAPDLLACLEAPLAGEPRAAFCRVAEAQLATFDRLCAERYAEWFVAVPTREAFERGLFGPDPVADLQSRAGNRILLMQGKRTLVQPLQNEPLPAMVGVHGGLHADETTVPLVCIDTD
ncbi:MAG: alkaline phosphatase family protein [Pseudomonadota bacterium]